MPYIEKEKVIEAIRKYADIKHSNGEPIEYVNGILKTISVINEQPTFDVEQVVRCKDCGYRNTMNCNAKHERTDMDFCSHGIIY